MKEQAPSLATCFNWYRKFDNGDKSLEDSRRTGRPHTQNRQLVLATCGEHSDLTNTSNPKYSMPFGLRESREVATSRITCFDVSGQTEACRYLHFSPQTSPYIYLDRLDRHDG
ncbi:unnamed protein product [Heligmosomoides polygyrus]|uniref:HTH_48 domain-containing protein n=1 Tax=Heligmosomoides polygyrus TaxID=6339 RepID=A0A183GNJ5_HELPZ|nr:unnamed protein product [Heligmosomoides polygyrus]